MKTGGKSDLSQNMGGSGRKSEYRGRESYNTDEDDNISHNSANKSWPYSPGRIEGAAASLGSNSYADLNRSGNSSQNDMSGNVNSGLDSMNSRKRENAGYSNTP